MNDGGCTRLEKKFVEMPLLAVGAPRTMRDHEREAQERYDSTQPDREHGLTDLLDSTRDWRMGL
jgi:hypothetical protein